MGQLQLITSNPVVEEYDRQNSIANQQAAQDLANAQTRQTIDFNTQANPIRLRDITSTANINEAGAKVAGATTQDKIDQSGAQTRESGANADVAQGTVQPRISLAGSQAQEGAANADVATGTVAPRISQANSSASSAASNATVDAGTVGSRISEAGSNAATAGSNAQTAAAGAQVATATVPAEIDLRKAQALVATNAAQYSKEGQFFDLFAKNPQAAIAQASQFGVPTSVVAVLQDQTKAAWLAQQWATIQAQLPGDANMANRAAAMELALPKLAGQGAPPTSEAQQLPAGSPQPMNAIDQRAQIAAKYLRLTPGSQGYSYYVSTGNLPAGQPVTGDTAKALGLDPGRTWQQDPNGKFVVIDHLTNDQSNYLAAQSDPINPFKGPFTDFLRTTKGAMGGLEARAQAANLQPGTPDYQMFMLTNGQVGDPTTIDSTAQMIANYKYPPLTSSAMRTAWGQKVTAAVLAANPAYNATTYGQRQKAMRDFGTGQQGNAVRSMNVAIHHLNVLDGLSQALDNGDIQAFNRFANSYKEQTGQPAPTNFDSVKAIVADEITKAVLGSPGALADREAILDVLKRSENFAQLKGATDNFRALMGGQLRGLRTQFKSSTGLGDDEFGTMIDPETSKELNGSPAPAYSQGDPLPQDRTQLKTGTIYQTGKGPATYLGNGQFQPVTPAQP